MRVLLRDGEAGPYYAGPREWVFDRERAKDFMLIERAIQVNTEQHLEATHVVLAYDRPACNLTLPVSNYDSFLCDGAQATSPDQPRIQG